MKRTIKKIETKEIETEVEVTLPYYATWANSFFYKIVGENSTDAIRVSDDTITQVNHDVVFDSSNTPCTAKEYNDAFVNTMKHLNDINNIAV